MSDCPNTWIISRVVVFLLLTCSVLVGNVHGQTPDSLVQRRSTRVFLDMPAEYLDYIRTQIAYVSYVRDRAPSQVQAILLKAETGGGGTQYIITLVGRQRYEGINDTLSFELAPGHTEDAARQRIVALLKRGLMRYVEKTPLADDISISYVKHSAQREERDRWDYWVFSLNSQGYVQGDKTWENIYLWNYLSANRVTPYLKIMLSLGTSYNENKFDVSDATVVSVTRSQYFNGLLVKSIDDHWSYGLSGDLSASSYSNVHLLSAVAPAIEYDVFPYSVSTREQLLILYRFYFEHVSYIEETIYDKHSECLYKQVLSFTCFSRQEWGSVTTSLAGSNFLHDFKKNRLSLTADISLNLTKGFSLTLSGQAVRTHDLLSPAKGKASYEDILLRRKQLNSQYSYYFSFGLQYSFGSIYSNVVNPRFGQ